MRYLTDRKRATGLGSAKSGVHHFWAMKVSSVALLILVPLFVFTFGPALGGSYEEVTTYFARPFPALVAALTFIIGWKHFNDGAQVLIEDYVHGTAQKITLILVTCLSYAAMATGLFAIAKIAL
ncbi:succinate dehydrogenase, hydrophobic membrane anchor protein [Lutimaribacter sp. EGI FJ00015]|uniref:Succinate dehydrogenase, hydrophobic membrane anchor protein n=1 Tax=Lutimaribacter degradans TaxID=2945989 RepID=A0ACC5ZYK7_9RHOB|nr:succinate dehydrogenase, hydrophobic membrane anchor protein [Lutimaribacter sp. EGI FJ00013]MCM2563437.1 succinate dehydrogenase, hydrophobic membrane anchor protein [Lutimaribacter sp. EGI FJ00013]MCO0614617.1 succinate dehydrogenase, hydrophobic membrane anchor protein [Lutimaribacter sp. EGI FJ00015]MCO0637288.1 succinate dehydrogenase, hydrophobic membrane anchor protein [Lutimaribacter sp. EGI FJ00014]